MSGGPTLASGSNSSKPCIQSTRRPFQRSGTSTWYTAPPTRPNSALAPGRPRTPDRRGPRPPAAAGPRPGRGRGGRSPTSRRTTSRCTHRSPPPRGQHRGQAPRRSTTAGPRGGLGAPASARRGTATAAAARGGTRRWSATPSMRAKAKSLPMSKRAAEASTRDPYSSTNRARLSAVNRSSIAATAAASSGSVRAPIHSSTHATKTGPSNIDHSRSMASSRRSAVGSMAASASRNSTRRRSRRCSTAAASSSAFVGKWCSCAPRDAGPPCHLDRGGGGVAPVHQAVEGGVEQPCPGGQAAVLDLPGPGDHHPAVVRPGHETVNADCFSGRGRGLPRSLVLGRPHRSVDRQERVGRAGSPWLSPLRSRMADMAEMAQEALFADEPTLRVGELAAAPDPGGGRRLPGGGVGAGRGRRAAPAPARAATSTSSCASATPGGARRPRCRWRCSGPTGSGSSGSCGPGPSFRMADGLEVRVRGRVQYGYGRLQLVVSAIDPVHTLGRLAADRERVLRLLAGDGLLEANRRLSLGPVPLHVAVVTRAPAAPPARTCWPSSGAAGSGSGSRWPTPRCRARRRAEHAPGPHRRRPAPARRRAPGAGRRGPHRPRPLRRRAPGPGRGPLARPGVRRGRPRDRLDGGGRGGPHRGQDPDRCAAAVVVALGGPGPRAGRGGVGRGGPAGRPRRLAGAGDGLDERAARLTARTERALAVATGRLDRRAGAVELAAGLRLSAEAARLEGLGRRVDGRRLVARLERLDGGLVAAGSSLGRSVGRRLDRPSGTSPGGPRDRRRRPGPGPGPGLLAHPHRGRAAVRAPDEVAPGDALVTTLADGSVRSTVAEASP